MILIILLTSSTLFTGRTIFLNNFLEQFFFYGKIRCPALFEKLNTVEKIFYLWLKIFVPVFFSLDIYIITKYNSIKSLKKIGLQPKSDCALN